MRLPSGGFVTPSQPIYFQSNFTWGEATKYCLRQPEDLYIEDKLIASAREIEKNIVATAKYLDEIRALLGNRPILVNSWYRPAAVNARVGGATRSRHLFGDGVDIRSFYYPPKELYYLLDEYHGDKGGLGLYYSFVHIDFRGTKARWW